MEATAPLREASPDADSVAYQAFVSYAREDSRIARKLHKALEAYRLPPGLDINQPVPSGADGRMLYPCFLDTDELRGGGLPDQIRQALRHSGALVVVCSRASADNAWVNAEISEFLNGHSPDRIFPVLVDDTTLVDDMVEGMFPTALRLAISAHGATTEPMTHWQPLAADLRLGRDGFALAVLKLVAGIKGLQLRDLAERQFRRARRRRLALSAMVALAVILGARFLGETVRATGWQDIHDKTDNALSQLEAWQNLQEIISMGNMQQSQMALLGFNAECSFSFGACGYYDEGFGYTAQSIRAASDNSNITGEDITRMVFILDDRIIEGFNLHHRIETDTDFPEGIFFERRTFGAYGNLVDSRGNRYFYNYKTIKPREKYYRVSYALIPFDAVPDIRYGEAVKAWGTAVPILLFAFHLFFEVLRFGRLFKRRVTAQEVGATQ